MNQVSAEPKYRILSGSHLKLIAVIAMLIDHTAVIFARSVIGLHQPLFGTSLTIYWVMRKIGRLAFPLFCFLLAEGFAHTKNRVKYGLNLLIFAVISEIPYNLMRSGNILDPNHQNVYVTLLMGFLLLCLWDSSWRNWLKTVIMVVAVFAISYVHADYGRNGVLLILLLYILREQKLLRGVLALPLLSGGYAAWCAFVPIGLYNGQRGFISGKVMKYAFYAFYPVHILLLYAIKLFII